MTFGSGRGRRSSLSTFVSSSQPVTARRRAPVRGSASRDLELFMRRGLHCLDERRPSALAFQTAEFVGGDDHDLFAAANGDKLRPSLRPSAPAR